MNQPIDLFVFYLYTIVEVRAIQSALQIRSRLTSWTRTEKMFEINYHNKIKKSNVMNVNHQKPIKQTEMKNVKKIDYTDLKQ